jgi:hypothetical protein
MSFVCTDATFHLDINGLITWRKGIWESGSWIDGVWFNQ